MTPIPASDSAVETRTAPRLSRWRQIDWRSKARAAAIHLVFSVALAVACALLVFGLWYPGQFRQLAGGRELFLLVTSIDVIMGPVLTLAVFDRSKSKTHLAIDLTVVVALQMGALAYGLYTVFVARPVAMVFEVDRLRLITAFDVHLPELASAPKEFRELPLRGPWLLGARSPSTPAEHTDALFMGLKGIDTGSRPIFWQPYGASKARALAKSRPIEDLIAKYPQRAADIRQRLAALGAEESSARFLPTQARGDWSAVLDRTGGVLGYLPVDGFF